MNSNTAARTPEVKSSRADRLKPWLTDDPFRPFFILAWLAGLAGMLSWPLWAIGAIGYPGLSHQSLLLEVWFGATLVGFLLTAGPRMLDAPRPSPAFTLVLLALFAATGGFALAGNVVGSRLLFFAALLLVAGRGVWSWKRRGDMPPPSFILVGLGLLLGLMGAGLAAWGVLDPLGAPLQTLPNVLLSQGLMVSATLGAGAFLGPRILGYPKTQDFPEMKAASAAWMGEARWAAGAAAAIAASWVLDASGRPVGGQLMRASAATVYVLARLPLWRTPVAGWMPQALRLGLLLLLAGLWLPPIAYGWKMASQHLILLGGMALVVWTVGARVTFGHCGWTERFRQPNRFIGAIAGLALAALAARLAAEVQLDQRSIWLGISGVAALVAHLIWGAVMLPKLISPRPDPEDD
jgi:uncharacterized protein involved in response to NO